MKPEHAQVLSKLYAETGVPVDRLPYTPQFETIRDGLIAATGQPYSALEVWKTLVYLRKSGRLPKVRAMRQRSLFEEQA